jgi:hypothetical protein
MKYLYYLLDAGRVLEEDGWQTQDEQATLESWFERYLHWLRNSPQGRKERAATNNHGTYYDLQVTAIAALLGEARLVRETLRDSRSRMLQQFDEHGMQPEELRRTNTAHYCCFNLQGWIHLAQLAEAFGEDLWCFETGDGRGIRRTMRWLLHRCGHASLEAGGAIEAAVTLGLGLDRVVELSEARAGRLALGLQRASKLHTVHWSVQVGIDQCEICVLILQQTQRLVCISGRAQYLVACTLQLGRQTDRNQRFVFDDQYSHH